MTTTEANRVKTAVLLEILQDTRSAFRTMPVLEFAAWLDRQIAAAARAAER